MIKYCGGDLTSYHLEGVVVIEVVPRTLIVTMKAGSTLSDPHLDKFRDESTSRHGKSFCGFQLSDKKSTAPTSRFLLLFHSQMRSLRLPSPRQPNRKSTKLVPNRPNLQNPSNQRNLTNRIRRKTKAPLKTQAQQIRSIKS